MTLAAALSILALVASHPYCWAPLQSDAWMCERYTCADYTRDGLAALRLYAGFNDTTAYAMVGLLPGRHLYHNWVRLDVSGALYDVELLGGAPAVFDPEAVGLVRVRRAVARGLW